MKHEKFKVTPLERAWILYDVGNSAFVLMIATLVPIFFNALAEAGGLSSVDYLAYWGYASSVVTVITAVLGPILGTLADTRGFKKPIFMLCLFVGVAGCCAMGLATTWLPFLIIFILAKIGFSGSLVFYDSMLGDVTTPERMDVVSSQGYAWGYIGSCVPFVVCLALVLGSGAIGLSQMTALSVALLITAVWWLGTTLPLLRKYKQINYVEVEQHAIRQSFVRIGHTLKHLHEDKQVFWFLLAFFCYIDGVYTIIDMATAYGTALGLETTGLLLALLVTQIVAFPSALIFGRLSAKYPSSQLIPVCIAAYTGIAVFAFFLTSQWQFWVLAVLVGMFQGGVQALSRSHFAKIIPVEKSGEYFGLFDICGKGASFLGTMIVSVGSQLTVSAKAVYKLADDVDLDHAALAEPLACCVHSIRNAKIQLGDDVVVIGAGIMGALHIRLAKMSGARVIVSELDPVRMDVARKMGADIVINANEADPIAQVKELTEGRGADAVFCTVATSAVAKQAVDMAGKLGRVVMYTSFFPDLPIEISPTKLHSGEQILTGSVNPNPVDFLTAARLLSRKLIDVSSLISDRVPMAEIDRILAELSADCAEHRDDISSDYDVLVRLDLIFAKAKLSYKLNCGAATLESDKGIVLRRARHPLLDQAKAEIENIRRVEERQKAEKERSDLQAENKMQDNDGQVV